uniref:FG-GAP-like repeat-containing protein n=1 Tax=Aquiflexum sp. TaxID=1872584 RepID=UPI0035942877
SRGFQSGTSTTLTFGLGNSEKIDSVLISWNSTDIEVFQNLDLDQRHLLVKGKGKESSFPVHTTESVLEIAEISLDWKHEERSIIDEFRREYLIPRRYGTEGPALAVGDLNGDGLDDIFLGGANGQPSALFFQDANGGFKKVTNPFFEQLKTAEDVVAVMEDFNQDGHLDLYVGSGGNEYGRGEIYNFDRVFLNDGNGNLVFSMNSLPPFGENTSAVAVHDVNGDGHPDIFVGASVVTGNYGAFPRSYLLLNDGTGKFQDATQSYFGEEFRPGMIQNAIWADITGDGQKELLLSGEWMPLIVYSLNDQQQFERLNISGLDRPGWYFGMSVIDVESNGLQDIVFGNLGLNSKLKASQEQPVWLYHHDFDGNGQTDPLIFHYMDGKLVPFASRDDLIKQIPALKRKHDSYVTYSKIKSPKDLIDDNQLKQANKYQVTELRSGVLGSSGSGTFEFDPFPIEAQFAPIKDFKSFKGKDGSQYLLGVGNFYGFRNDLGKNGSQPLTLLKWADGTWVNVPIGITSNDYWGEYRKVELIHIGETPHLVAVRNNEKPVFLKINQ